MSLIERISDSIRGQKTQAFLADTSKYVLFDVTVGTSKSKRSEVTRHAIEKGSDVSDHVIESPESFSFTAVLTDDNKSLANPSSYTAFSIIDREQILLDWMDNKTVLTYYGHEIDIENVVLESCSRKKTQSAGSGLEIDIALRKVNIVESQTVTVTIKGATAKKTDSKNGTKSAAAEKKKSWLATLAS